MADSFLVPDVVNDMAVQQNDLGYQMLHGLFDVTPNELSGGVGAGDGIIAPGMPQLLAEQASIFNSVVLVALSFMVAFSMGTALVATNYEGVSFGKKFHTIFGPIRIAIAVLALAPMPGGSGFSVIQDMVIRGGYVSIGMATYMAKKGVDRLGTIIEDGGDMDGRSSFLLPLTQELVGNTLNMFVMSYYGESRRLKDTTKNGLKAWKNQIKNSGNHYQNLVDDKLVTMVKEDIPVPFDGWFGDEPAGLERYTYTVWAYDRNMKGSWRLNWGKAAKQINKEQRGKLQYAKMGSISVVCDLEILSEQACSDRQILTQNLMAQIAHAAKIAVYNGVDYRTLAQQSFSSKSDADLFAEGHLLSFDFNDSYKKIIDFQTDYRQLGIQSAAFKENAENIHTAIKNRIEKDGFIMLGSSHLAMGQILEAISKQAGTMTAASLLEFNNQLKEYAEDLLDKDNPSQFRDVLRNAQATMNVYIDKKTEEVMLEGKDDDSEFAKLLNGLIGEPLSLVSNFMEIKPGEDPILRLQNTGHGMISAL